MSEEVILSSGKIVRLEDTFPNRSSKSGGRTRRPTDYDDLVINAYRSDQSVTVEFEDEDEKRHEQKEIDKALELHGLGADREVVEGVLWVKPREKRQYRPRQGQESESSSEEDEETNDSWL